MMHQHIHWNNALTRYPFILHGCFLQPQRDVGNVTKLCL